MGYVGVPPQSGFITTAKQRVTSSTNNYVDLDHSISSLADVILWVNFVKQDSTNLSLTTSTRITLGATLVASDIVEIAYLGKAVATQTPDTGTVTNDMLAGSIANSKLATDPLNASNLASGTVPTARLGSGTASSSTVLYGDQTYKTAPSGGLTLVTSGTGSSVTQVNFDSIFTNAYKAYKFVGGFRPATNGEDLWFVLRSGGSNAGASSYRYVVKGFIVESSGDSEALQNAWGNPYWKISTNGASNNSSHMQYVDMNFYNPMAASTTFGADNPFISGSSTLYSGGAQVVYSLFACMYNSSANYDGLHMTFSSGNINAYNYQVYGFNPS